MKPSYSEKFRLRISDFDIYDNVTPCCALDLFQDVAGKHADMIGVGFDEMIKRDLIWVLIRTKVEFLRPIGLYSTVKVITWPKEKGRMDFDREYEILDEKNNVCVKAISKWVVVNFKTRRISFAKDVSYKCQILSKTNYPDSIARLEDFDIADCEIYKTRTTFSDLDHNGHINNVNYAKYVLNALKLNKEENILSFEINYVKELKEDKEIALYFKKEGKTYFVKALSDDVLIFIANVKLK